MLDLALPDQHRPRARALDNWKRYRKAGINISIGSDTYPRDMVMNMRTGLAEGKIMGHDYYKASAGEVFEAPPSAARARSGATISASSPQARWRIF